MKKSSHPVKRRRTPRPPGGPRAVTQENYRVLANFRHALLKFLAFSEEAAKEAGLSPKQHQALLAIKGSADNMLSVQELADRLFIRHHSAVELVDRLAESGLVARSRDPLDGRRAQLRLTPPAEKILIKLSAAHLKELKAIQPILQALVQDLG
jgi:DNA-binding MarR family transcriptional regulator